MSLVNECPWALFKQPKFSNYSFKSQRLQFLMHLIHNFSLKTFHLECLKSDPRTLVNISL